MAPLQLFLGVKSCACEIERQITMVGASAWAGAMQTPRSSTLTRWLRLLGPPQHSGPLWEG